MRISLNDPGASAVPSASPDVAQGVESELLTLRKANAFAAVLDGRTFLQPHERRAKVMGPRDKGADYSLGE